MPSSTMSTENCFCGIVWDDALEIVDDLLRGVVSHRMRTLSVIHAILNAALCDDKNEMFHSGDKLMFSGQSVKKFLGISAMRGIIWAFKFITTAFPHWESVIIAPVFDCPHFN